MSDARRPPKVPESKSEAQRKSSTDSHSPRNVKPSRTTTFLTHDPGRGRAPSAYSVNVQANEVGTSQRARQQHDGGPAVTREKSAVHAFTKTKDMQKAVTSLTKQGVQQQKQSPQKALRLQIMDGLARPDASAGDQHMEAFQSELGRGNPHRSGGQVQFPAPGSGLADFDKVRQRTQSGESARNPVQDSVSSVPTEEAKAFNRAATSDQHKFAKSVLKPK